MADKDDVKKGKELSAEDSSFRNDAYRAIRALTQENKRLKDMSILGRQPKGERKVAKAPHIQGLQTLNPRLGQQFQGKRND